MAGWIDTLEDLHALYGTPGQPAVAKVTPRLTQAYRTWIERSRFWRGSNGRGATRAR